MDCFLYGMLFYYMHITKQKEWNMWLTKFHLDAGQSSAQTFMNGFVHPISVQVGCKFSIRECENIICKVLRKEKSSNDRWCDLVLPGQGIFEPYNNHIIIHMVINHKYNYDNDIAQSVSHGSLLNYWPFKKIGINLALIGKH